MDSMLWHTDLFSVKLSHNVNDYLSFVRIEATAGKLSV